MRFIFTVFCISIVLIFALLLNAKAEERNTFTREEAIIFLNQKIDGNTDYNIGKWLIGHVEKFPNSHKPMIVRATDNYQFHVAKNTTFRVEEYRCAEVHTLFKPMGIKNKESKKMLQMALCSKGNVVTVVLYNQESI